MEVTPEETPDDGHCHGGKDGQHTWRFSNTYDTFYCTTPGCKALDRGDDDGPHA